MAHSVELDVAGRCLRLETGRIAKQASGAVWASYGDTVVLATAVGSQNLRSGVDFLPLTVDYQEKTYAAGKIPGGYFKREGRPSEREVLTSRLIDRPIRPLFPEGYFYETQVIASVVSADKTGISDVIGITAASAALSLSDVPFAGPVAGVKIGRDRDWAEFWRVLTERLMARYGRGPVHSLEEICLLASRFPEEIQLVTARIGSQVVAGTVLYDSGITAHAQYIGASEEGLAVGALDLLFGTLLSESPSGRRFFDFGISTEQDGRFLNSGLLAQKEGFGARGVTHDFFELQL